MIRLFVTGILVLLTACSSLALQPNYELLEKAITIQIQQTKKDLEQKLDLDWEKFNIGKISIDKQQALTIENLPAYHVQGSYDLTVKLPNKELTEPEKTFDIYLQIQREGKSWRLLIPENTNTKKPSVWYSYLIL